MHSYYRNNIFTTQAAIMTQIHLLDLVPNTSKSSSFSDSSDEITDSSIYLLELLEHNFHFM